MTFFLQHQTYPPLLLVFFRDSENEQSVSLSPLVDSNGVLRAKECLRRTKWPFETKHLIILPSKHRAVELFLVYRQKNSSKRCEVHIKIVHSKFRIFGLRSAFRTVNHICVTLRLLNNSESPQMSDLPVDQVTSEVRPITNTGVDYYGPFEVKLFRRHVKNWVSLFTCLGVQKVHLELVDSLDTTACIHIHCTMRTAQYDYYCWQWNELCWKG